MGEYALRRSDVFVFDESPELIVHVADFRLSEEHPRAVSLEFAGKALVFSVVGTGTQHGKVVVRLAVDPIQTNSSDFEALRNLDQRESLKLISRA
jgi:hypothetical protein